MSEPTSAIPQGGDDNQHLNTVDPGGELPGTDPNSADALDAALLEASKAEGIELDDEAQKAADAAEAKAKAAEDEAAAKAKAAEDEAAAAKTDEEKAAEAAAVEKAAAAAAPKDKFDEIKLPPYSKPKTGEAFDTVKTMARQEIAEAQKKLAEIQAERDALAEKVKTVGNLPPETAKELEELRAFRAKLDVEADPKFKEWDAKVTENNEFIYAKLKASGTGDEVIAKIKEMGGPGEVNWEVVGDKLPSHIKRYIETKLVENEDLADRRKKALEDAKANATEYVKTKAAESGKVVQSRIEGVQKKVSELSPNIEWINDKTAATGAKAEEIAAVAAHNKRASEIRATMQEAVHNDTPEMKGLLVLGIAQLQRVNGEFADFQAAAAAKEKALEKELTELKARFEKVKRSSPGRVVSGAPTTPAVPKADGKVNIHESGSEALDRQLAEALKAQE